MKAKIVRIGNSQGIRIPKPLLEQTGLREEVDLTVENHRIVIAPPKPETVPPRKGWAKAFKDMAAVGDDHLLDGDRQLPTHWDEAEWEWE
ncbi:MAG: AbrB/MazE/SpoVT family DNA-binding domain-containing protein [Candidatus Eisenbacteria bacterium]|nr:AbrB/MazE/SpoVT family DNA-binding domain-containing protein [Candidatus Eisenbacteria bacterium]